MLRSFYKLYLLLIIGVAISAMAVVPIMQHLFVSRYNETDADGVHSALYVMRDRLAKVPESQWNATIANTRPPFPLIEFNLTKRFDWNLSAAEQQHLARGYSVEHIPGELLVGIPPTDQLLRVTQARSGFAVIAFQILAWSSVALVLLGGVLFWLRAHWRDLEKLRKAAERFGHGNLDTRAALPEHSSIAPLAKRFDSMAGRIQTLVTTQNDMIHAISHELRTPIARFGFGLALLQSAKTEAERQRHTEALSRDVTELDQLVGELLSYGALDQSDRAPDPYQVNLVELIDSVIGSLALEMEQLDVQCTVAVSIAAEQAIIDPRLTARALINLVKNAMRYGQGKIAVSAEIARGKLMIRVDDNGIGIPSADRKTIFEPFHRLDRSRDRDTGGFGLGLAIAMRAIQSQDGHLRAMDSPMGGARLEIALPQPSVPVARVLGAA